jgi:hypothetical protein
VGSWVATGGRYSIATSALTDGTHSITAIATDVAGNDGAESLGLSVTIDTAAPILSVTGISPDTGTSGSDGITTAGTVTVSGTIDVADAARPVTVFRDGTSVGAATVDQTTGVWTLTNVTLTEGSHTFTAQATDAAANIGTSNSFAVTKDTTTPATPSVPDLAAASDTGSSATDNITSITTPTFTGTAEAGSTVTIFSDGVAVGSGVATGGTYAVATSALAAGTHSMTATATDTAGNISATSTGLAMTIDTTAPSAPSVPDLDAASDLGSSATDNITSISTPTFTGTAEAGSTVTLFDGTTAIGTAIAKAGRWSITTLTLTDGTHSITAKATDVAGNVSTASSAVSVAIEPANFAILDTTTHVATTDLGGPYTGPVDGLQNQYINATNDSLNITALTANCFIHSGSGNDAIDVSKVGGTNVLDGSTGSNFLVGGSGSDTFFVDDRGPKADIWSTVANFGKGDAATIWGVTAADFHLAWVDGQGATGYTGLTLHATEAGAPTASLTLAGFTQADLGNGRLSVSFGNVGGNAYMYVHGNG